MFLLDTSVSDSDQDLIYSASDLVIASKCEYQLLRILDEKLGRRSKLGVIPDSMLERAADLGDVHEQKVLDEYIDQIGQWDPATRSGVYEVQSLKPEAMTEDSLAEKHEETIDALRAGADVVFQGSFFDGQFHGRSDFLVSTAPGTYAVYDTKLARHAKVEALLQLAAYGDQLIQAGVDVHPQVTLVLGNGNHSNHSLTDLLPVFRERRQRLLDLTHRHHRGTDPVEWDREDITACGRCDYCQDMVKATRDLLLVTNMSTTRRKKLRDQGVYTIDDLASMEVPPENKSLTRLQDQARMQVGSTPPHGTATYQDKKKGIEETISYRVLENNILYKMPKVGEGDIFFDFEGDPLWQDDDGEWGLEYLFGIVEPPTVENPDPVFRPFWAHTRAEERQAFIDFLDYVAQRRKAYPDMKIYHYAAYEKTALRNLSLRHVVGEEAVDQLLIDNVLVDLYEIVRHSIRISENSYSIKKLEPLYMGDQLRSGEVGDAATSVVEYANYCDLRDSGDELAAQDKLAQIAHYNKDDCISTLKLRNWLLELAAAHPATPSDVEALDDEQRQAIAPSPEEARLLDFIADLASNHQLTADERAIAMVAAAVSYHRRERKQFWWGHHDRLDHGLTAWEDMRDIFTVDTAEALSDWERPTPRSNPAREIRLTGSLGKGSVWRPGDELFVMYEEPHVPAVLRPELINKRTHAGSFGVKIVEVDDVGTRHSVIITERLKKGAAKHSELPMGLTPNQPVQTDSIETALSELAVDVGRKLPELPKHPGADILRRRPPRLASLPSLPVVENGADGYINAITGAVHDLDQSYIAVQGPPGTGKTYVGSHIIARLVADGWKVGIVGQSHAVVENLIRAAVKAGVPGDRIAKKASRHDVPWTHRRDGDVATLLADEGGVLIGGTAWVITGKEVPAGSLDLLVIDEAGQFCLADTLAVTQSASRLLLLGDPQQLPQVSTGTHPEPVNQSALGWLVADNPTLPQDMGYFLADSWRMHPELCSAVSKLSYENRLESATAARSRKLDGAGAGIECVMVPHSGNSTSSPEEAAEVVDQVRAHLGLKWTSEENATPRPLEEADILVVAAYNAQVRLVQDQLQAAGLDGVRVGTVDKFQGQEAVVVIVSLACSDAAEAPRGIEFLLNRNRINVAISRGQWKAVIIRSSELTKHMPNKPTALEGLGAFIGLCGVQV